tara:strand:- start:2151 stop:2351 length:201 start_codon:yes stop_codon:yes gene_type:complete
MDIYTFKRDTYNFIKIVSKIHILLGARLRREPEGGAEGGGGGASEAGLGVWRGRRRCGVQAGTKKN